MASPLGPNEPQNKAILLTGVFMKNAYNLQNYTRKLAKKMPKITKQKLKMTEKIKNAKILKIIPIQQI